VEQLDLLYTVYIALATAGIVCMALATIRELIRWSRR
jgi:hypothetical protein